MISQFFSKAKDGGPQSPVDAYFLIEIKGLFTIALLKFNQGAREQFHTHAFNALTWFLCGEMDEASYDGQLRRYRRSLIPKFTPRDKNHRVIACVDSWCLTVRGPWCSTWTEHDRGRGLVTTFSDGRLVVDTKRFN